MQAPIGSATTGTGAGIDRYDEAVATPDLTGDIEVMAPFAGRSIGLTDESRPAGTVLEELVAETEEAISGLPDGSD